MNNQSNISDSHNRDDVVCRREEARAPNDPRRQAGALRRAHAMRAPDLTGNREESNDEG